jgi:uncharacterized C2H2 Zn-finger protein
MTCVSELLSKLLIESGDKAEPATETSAPKYSQTISHNLSQSNASDTEECSCSNTKTNASSAAIGGSFQIVNLVDVNPNMGIVWHCTCVSTDNSVSAQLTDSRSGNYKFGVNSQEIGVPRENSIDYISTLSGNPCNDIGFIGLNGLPVLADPNPYSKVSYNSAINMYVCTLCDTTFRRKYEFLRHFNTSHQSLLYSSNLGGLNRFNCPECGKSYSRRDSLLRHRRIKKCENNCYNY